MLSVSCCAGAAWLWLRLASRAPEWEELWLPRDGYVLETDQISPDGRLFVSSDTTGQPLVVDRHRSRVIARCPSDGTVTTSTHFSPDASEFVTTAIDGAARIWALRQGECSLVKKLPHAFPLYEASYAPDGESLVAVGEDSSATIWDTRSGQPRLRLGGEESALVSASFSPTLPRVLTLSHDGVIRIWSVATGALLSRLSTAEAIVWARFDSAGESVLAGLGDGSARAWREKPLFGAALFMRHELWAGLLLAAMPLLDAARWLRSGLFASRAMDGSGRV